MLGFDKQFEDWDWTCFEKDAKINTKFGIKNIQDIKIGDLVLSFNEKSHKFEYKKVLRKFEKIANKTLHFKLSNGQAMKVTPEHKILVNGIWKEAGEIKINDTLLSPHGKYVAVESINLINKKTRVYNFETEDNHTYIAYGVVVHNKCPSQLEGFNYYKAGVNRESIDDKGNQEPLKCNLGECKDRLNLNQVLENKDNILLDFTNSSYGSKSLESILKTEAKEAKLTNTSQLFFIDNGDINHSWKKTYKTSDLFFGEVTLKLKDGYIGVNPDGSYVIKAKLAAWDDYYDFNRSNRGFGAEDLTTFGRNTPGKNFYVQIRGKPLAIYIKGKIK